MRDKLDCFGLPIREPYTPKKVTRWKDKVLKLSDARPACYCCGSDQNLRQVKNPICVGGTAWICKDCEGMTAQVIPKISLLIKCPRHGDRNHFDVKATDIGWRRNKEGKTTFLQDFVLCSPRLF